MRYPCGCIVIAPNNVTHCERHAWDERGGLRNRVENPAASEWVLMTEFPEPVFKRIIQKEN